MSIKWREKLKFTRSSLFWRTYLLNLILIFSSFAVFWFSAQAVLPEISRKMAQKVTDQEVKRLNEQIHTLIAEFQAIGQWIQSQSQYLSGQEDLSPLLKQVVASSLFIDYAAVINNKGTVIAAYPEKAGGLKGDGLGDHGYVTDALRQKKIVVSDVFIGQEIQPLLVIGVPLFNAKGEVDRIVALQIRLMENRFLESFFQNIDFGSKGYVYIVDHKGHIISHPEKNRIGDDAGKNPAVQQIMAGKSGYQRLVNTRGVEMYASYQYLPALRWGVVAQIPLASTYESLFALQKTVVKFTLLLLVPLLALIALYTRRMILPLRELSDAVEQVAQGNYEYYVKSAGHSEISILSHRFNEMIDHLKESRERLARKEQQLQEQRLFLNQLFDINPSFIYVRDRDGTYTLANQALANLYGTTVEKIVGKNIRTIFQDEQTVETLLKQDRQVMDTLEPMALSEMMLINPQSEKRWVQLTCVPIISSDGTSHQVLGVGNEITERKQREWEIECQALHDALTGLPNRTFFQKRGNEKIELYKHQPEKQMATLFLDLDNFKKINDTLGHAVGDQLLVEVTRRLTASISPENFLARMGGG